MKLLYELKYGKAAGSDGIRKKDLLVDPIMTARCLTHASLSSSKLSDAWKLAHANPLHKRGAADQPNNFIPISLTSIPCKLMQHIILHCLNQSLNSLLHNRQHGFRKGLSCETQLYGKYHDIARCVDRDTVHTCCGVGLCQSLRPGPTPAPYG